MARAGLYPPDGCRPTRSEAERRLHAALSRHLPRGWHAWHSLRLKDRRRIDGEGDFVIAVPGRGLLVLEVKGGRIEVRGGRWYQNGAPLDEPPRAQGLAFAGKLLRRLDEKGCRPPAWGVATCLPDQAFDEEPGQDDVRGRVLGAQDLPWLGDALPALVERALPEPGFERGPWIDRLHELWGETWAPRPRLGQRARMDEAERCRLDAQQLETLELIELNDRLLVHGGAGTGKTLLACEAARREARAGRRPLLLCFTDALGRWMRSSLEGERVEVSTVRALALELLRGAGLEVGARLSAEQWGQLPWRAVAEALPGLELGWDTVVLDEAQDLDLGDWALVEKLSEGRRLWAFHDPAQAFWEDRAVLGDLFAAQFRLGKGYRCPEPLLRVAAAYAGAEPDPAALREAVEAGHLAVRACAGDAGVLKAVSAELRALRSEGLAPSDIAIVSLRGQTPEDAVIRQRSIDGHLLVRADDPALEDHVVAETFLRFKGLERPAVIVTDLRLVEDRRDVRMHIALTRAMLTARVVAPRDALEKDPLLSRAL